MKPAPEHWPIHERISQMELGQYKEYSDRTIIEMTVHTVLELKREQDDIKKFLWGNGKVGLAEQVRYNTWFRKTGQWVIGVMVLSAIGAIIMHFTDKF